MVVVGVDSAPFRLPDHPASWWRLEAKTLILGTLTVVRQTAIEQLSFVGNSAKCSMSPPLDTLLLSHFTYKETEAQRSEVTCLSSHSQ